MEKKKRTQRIGIRSSETTRETPKLQFDFIAFSTNASTNKSTAFVTDIQKKRNQNLVTDKRKFLEWFIGFLEAEGSFTYWTDKKKIRFRIDVGQQDKDLIYFIQKQFGFGKVVEINRKNANPNWRYQVEDLPSLLRMIDLFNGNLVLQKRQTVFKKWLLGLRSNQSVVAGKARNTLYSTKRRTHRFFTKKKLLNSRLQTGGCLGF